MARPNSATLGSDRSCRRRAGLGHIAMAEFILEAISKPRG